MKPLRLESALLVESCNPLFPPRPRLCVHELRPWRRSKDHVRLTASDRIPSRTSPDSSVLTQRMPSIFPAHLSPFFFSLFPFGVHFTSSSSFSSSTCSSLLLLLLPNKTSRLPTRSVRAAAQGHGYRSKAAHEHRPVVRVPHSLFCGLLLVQRWGLLLPHGEIADITDTKRIFI